jgi:hypothetical protein
MLCIEPMPSYLLVNHCNTEITSNPLKPFKWLLPGDWDGKLRWVWLQVGKTWESCDGGKIDYLDYDSCYPRWSPYGDKFAYCYTHIHNVTHPNTKMNANATWKLNKLYVLCIFQFLNFDMCYRYERCKLWRN